MVLYLAGPAGGLDAGVGLVEEQVHGLCSSHDSSRAAATPSSATHSSIPGDSSRGEAPDLPSGSVRFWTPRAEASRPAAQQSSRLSASASPASLPSSRLCGLAPRRTSSFRALTCAPRPMSTSTTRSCPKHAAQCSSVSCGALPWLQPTGSPPSTSSRTRLPVSQPGPPTRGTVSHTSTAERHTGSLMRSTLTRRSRRPPGRMPP